MLDLNYLTNLRPCSARDIFCKIRSPATGPLMARPCTQNDWGDGLVAWVTKLGSDLNFLVLKIGYLNLVV
jgi:hypothetical protein